MSEPEILKWIAITSAVFVVLLILNATGGLAAVVVAATLADAVLRQVEARRALAIRRDDTGKL